MAELVYPIGLTAVFLPLPTADNPSSEEAATGDILPIVEPSGEVIARAMRSYVHSGSKLLHPVVHLHILDRQGRIYLQKRSPEKDLYPGFWDTAVGGHADYGESIAEALFREAGEELGLYDFNPVFITDYIYESQAEREMVNVFACVGDYRPEPDGIEVVDGRFWTVKEIESNFEKSIFTPNFEHEFGRLKNQLLALL